jgi:murein tripeptide amidase MpaA
MRKGASAAALAMLVWLASGAPALGDSKDPLNAYRVTATPKVLERLALEGFDVAEGRRGDKVEIYGTAQQLGKLADQGIRARLVKDRKDRTSAQRSARIARRARAAQASEYTGSDAAYSVWRRYDRVPGDSKEQYLELYDRLAGMPYVKSYDIGDTYMSRDIVALKVTKGADTQPVNSKPAVLYNALQHAREWLAGETCRRTLLYVTSQYGKDPQITRLVDTRELWFVCVANPDGYEYTFTPGNRLWRKNMADNDSDGTRGETGDGVDPNRNFPRNWGLDNEGSSPEPDSETFRGPSAGSEPETKAMIKLMDMVDFAFQKNDHTAAELLLYPQGFQQYTPSADHGIFTALAGDDADPGIATFDPDLSAELYITNGDTADYAYAEQQILSYTPEGSEPADTTVSGFEFEDKESAIEAEFQRHKAFALDLAESADDPDDPESHLGNTTQNFYVDPFAYSYGDPQPVQVTAKKSLGPLVMRYRINGGPIKQSNTTAFAGGERYYDDDGVYYRRMRGTVTGTKIGDTVEVWFAQASGNKRSSAFTYAAVEESDDRVLLMAAEDYTGPTPAYADTTQPTYLGAYSQALTANGVAHDVYDVDARSRKAPHPLGVLSHYDAVVWYTGDDYLTREPDQVPGTGTSRLALEEVTAVRDYLNEGGKLIYAGKNAGQEYAEGYEFRNVGFPQPNESKQGRWCDADLAESRDGCISHTNDFLQYHLGAYVWVDNGSSWNPATNAIFPIAGADPFGPITFAPTAGNPALFGAPTSTLAVTSSLEDSPKYANSSERLAGWSRGGAAGPFAPHTDAYYMAAGADDQAYKRLATTVAVPAGGESKLQFWTSYDIETDWDYMFVEVREVGTENWTTLPDANGHTQQGTGESCPEGWIDDLHPQLAHYQSVGRDDCSPTGSTGTWNAATGSSAGWQQWQIDLSAFNGKQVELSIAYVTDWGTTGLGAWVDDVQLTLGGAAQAAQSFETDTAPWVIADAPAGTANPAPKWERTTEQFTEAAVVGAGTATGGGYEHDSVYAGFDLSSITTPEERATFMRSSLRYLGILP